MASIITNIEHGFEAGAEDVLKAIPFIKRAIEVTVKAEPQVIAALGVLLGKAATAAGDITQAASTPFNIQLDTETVNALKAVWPALEAFASALGIKL